MRYNVNKQNIFIFCSGGSQTNLCIYEKEYKWYFVIPDAVLVTENDEKIMV